MWQVVTHLIDVWESWAEENSPGPAVRFRAVEAGLRAEAEKNGVQVTPDEWAIFFGLLTWRELGESALLLHALMQKPHKVKLSVSNTRFLMQARPKGRAQLDIRTRIIQDTHIGWAFWQEHPTQYELASLKDMRRWSDTPAIQWLFEGSFWKRCPPLRGEVPLIDACHQRLQAGLIA
jgi:hypothetical protein